MRDIAFPLCLAHRVGDSSATVVRPFRQKQEGADELFFALQNIERVETLRQMADVIAVDQHDGFLLMAQEKRGVVQKNGRGGEIMEKRLSALRFRFRLSEVVEEGDFGMGHHARQQARKAQSRQRVGND